MAFVGERFQSSGSGCLRFISLMQTDNQQTRDDGEDSTEVIQTPGVGFPGGFR